MRKLQQASFLLLLIIFSCNSQQLVPEHYARVNDYANVLTDDEELKLNDLLQSLEDSIGSQLAIISIESLKGQTIEEYSIEVAEDWHIGRADYDDGILVTLAVSDRKVRIEVGYGLELIIKDEIAKKIIDSTMIPEFITGNFYGGLTAGCKEIIDLIYTNPELVGKKWEYKE